VTASRMQEKKMRAAGFVTGLNHGFLCQYKQSKQRK
jgi:hypothetical protein